MNSRLRGPIHVASIPKTSGLSLPATYGAVGIDSASLFPSSPATFPGCADYATSRSISHRLSALGNPSGIRHFFSSASIRKSETPSENHQRLPVTIGVGNSAEASRIPRHAIAGAGRRWMNGLQSRVTSTGGEAGKSGVRSDDTRRILGLLAVLASGSRPSQQGRFASDLIDGSACGTRFPREYQGTSLADQWLGLSMFSHDLGSSRRDPCRDSRQPVAAR